MLVGIRTRSQSGFSRGATLLVVAALTFAACGGSKSASPAAPTSSQPSTSTAPVAPKGPATARFTFTGDKGLAGLATKPAISCNMPGLDGTSIFVLAQPQDPKVLFNMTVTAGKIFVRVVSGSGTAFRLRSFTGVGVTGFDSAVGAHFDTRLVEDPPTPGQNKGDLGAVVALKGSLSCGNQTTGSSTITFTGDTAEGAMGGAMSPVRVACIKTTAGNGVQVVGIVKTGNRRAMQFATFYPGNVTIFDSVAPRGSARQAQHSYLAKAAGAVTLNAGGAHVDGTATESYLPAGAVPHVLHFVGDAKCGSKTAA